MLNSGVALCARPNGIGIVKRSGWVSFVEKLGETGEEAGMRSPYFRGIPMPGLETLGLRTPTTGPKSDSDANFMTYCVTYRY